MEIQHVSNNSLTISEPSLLKFSASWCAPCKVYNPKFKEYAEQSNYPSFVLDVDENSKVAQEFNIRSVPSTLLVNKEGNVLKSATGVLTVDELKETFDGIEND